MTRPQIPTTVRRGRGAHVAVTPSSLGGPAALRRRQPAKKCIAIALSRTDVSQGDDLSVRFLGDGSDGDGLFVDIQSDIDRGRLVMADLRECFVFQHDAALASDKLTRVSNGGQLIHTEVIMSRLGRLRDDRRRCRLKKGDPWFGFSGKLFYCHLAKTAY